MSVLKIKSSTGWQELVAAGSAGVSTPSGDIFNDNHDNLSGYVDFTTPPSTPVGSATISGGLLTVNGVNNANLKRAENFTDGVLVTKIKTPAAWSSSPTFSSGILFKVVSESSFLLASTYDNTGSGGLNLGLWKYVSGTFTQLGSLDTSSGGLVAENYYTVVVMEGNRIFLAVTTLDPYVAGLDLSSSNPSVILDTNYRLTGADATTYGKGVAARTGLLLRTTSTSGGLDWFRASKSLNVGSSIAPPLIHEKFDAVHPNWVPISGQNALTVSNGQLVCTEAANHRSYRSDVLVEDARHICKVTPGSNWLADLILKRVTDNDYLYFASAQTYSGSAWIATRLGGSGTNVLSVASPTSGTFWMVARVTGNKIRAETWQNDPHDPGSTPYATVEYTLSGAGATTLGSGVKGNPGVNLSGYTGSVFIATDAKVDDWIVADSPGIPSLF